ncbi:hypothetical protein EHO57_14060 [Leptospira langatensis]|uniref:Histidine kinase N-terminal 7TM region domain-containing protein n=2 Tax=Leptospira langatensis TaxID=2484983 RepID=A0A5R2ATU6_9LEPT|nr:hypothetical protein [Leptospira langatensis]TGJ99879.1 hypothetical protein EHO57_14060 [Leptospira langatensis]
MRNFIPLSLAQQIPNWTLGVTVLIPFFLLEVVRGATNRKHPSRGIRFAEALLLSYLLYSAFACKMIVVTGNISVYRPLLAYHILIAYAAFYCGSAVLLLISTIQKTEGNRKFMALIMTIGIAYGLCVALLFIYLLPIFGIFKGYLSSIGVLGWAIHWAIILVDYGALEISQVPSVLDERPILLKVFAPSLRLLQRFFCPNDYSERLRKERAALVEQIMLYDLDLRENANLSRQARYERVGERFALFL